MKEKDLYPHFGKYIAEKYKGSSRDVTSIFEIKLVREGKPLRVYDFKSHQLRALSMSKHQSIYFKPPDTSLTPSPCDVFYIKGSRSYAVVSFLPEWRLCYFIDIDVIQKQFGIKNSITKEECDAICEWKDYL